MKDDMTADIVFSDLYMHYLRLAGDVTSCNLGRHAHKGRILLSHAKLKPSVKQLV